MDKPRYPVRIASDAEQLVDTAYGIVQAALSAKHADAPFSIVLSGGATPEPVFKKLAQDRSIDWQNVHFFWGDERSVGPEDEQSNFRMANEALLRNIDVPEANVHRIQAEQPPEEAADQYEEEIRRTLELDAGESPRFDLVLLGMGEDGHTASLFPGTQALDEQERLVVANDVPQLDTTRVTLTYPALNAARQVMFIVSGSDKSHALQQVLYGPEHEMPPAGWVQPTNGSIIWLIDEDAVPKKATATSE